MSRTFALALVLAGCFGMPTGPAYQPADPAATQAQARRSAARSMGEPTKKSPDELDATIQKQTKDFKPTKQHAEGRLESPERLTIKGVKGTCYTIVMRLGAGANWGIGAEARLSFDLQSTPRRGSG